MPDPDPRRAIIEYLIQPGADQPPAGRAAPSPGSQPARPVASVVRGNPFTADRATIEFVKERGLPDRRLFAITFDDLQHNEWFWLAATKRDYTGNWVAHGVAGGSDGPRTRSPSRSGARSSHSEPSLNLAGNWGQGRIYAGGEVYTAGADIGRVCLTLADDTQLTDDAEGGVALFLNDQTEAAPASIDIYDADGRPLATRAV
jgi:hypothetical protein